MLKNKKIISLLAIILIIIIAGIIMLCVKGMNYELLYGANTTIETYINSDVQLSDIKAIVDETFGTENNIRLLDELDNDILITVKTASDEQIDTLISKINEKYSLELSKSNLIIENNARVKLLDLVKPYIFPVVLTTLVILAYFIIRYRNYGIIKVVVYTILTVVVLQVLVLSFYAITRIPVNHLTMPISMLVFILSILGLVKFFENKIK